MHDTKPKTAPCRVCGAQVENGYIAAVGLCPSERDRKLARKWLEDCGGLPYDWVAWKRRQFERWIGDFEPIASFICELCLESAKQGSEAGDERTLFCADEPADDEFREAFLAWTPKPATCDGESWHYRIRQACHVMALCLHENHSAEGGAGDAK